MMIELSKSEIEVLKRALLLASIVYIDRKRLPRTSSWRDSERAMAAGEMSMLREKLGGMSEAQLCGGCVIAAKVGGKCADHEDGQP